MSNIKNLYPAFPCDRINAIVGTEEKLVSNIGISMRDYFAAKALQGMLADSKRSGTLEAFAHDAYQAAEAMLRARGEA